MSAFVWLTVMTAFRILSRNRLRAGLTMLGIVIGVGAVIAMVSIGEGAKQAVRKQIATMGTNVIIIWPNYTTVSGVRGAQGSAVTLTVADAMEFFSAQNRIAERLELLNDVGLGYLHLGQSATTLSGGEAQRVKLATELAKRDTGRTLYILDEPTTGLHFEDVRLLLEVLHRLVQKGNTVIVIEHNLDVIKTADWVLDLGPEGGTGGGRIVAQGTPEQVAGVSESHTGRFLRSVLTV